MDWLCTRSARPLTSQPCSPLTMGQKPSFNALSCTIPGIRHNGLMQDAPATSAVNVQAQAKPSSSSGNALKALRESMYTPTLHCLAGGNKTFRASGKRTSKQGDCRLRVMSGLLVSANPPYSKGCEREDCHFRGESGAASKFAPHRLSFLGSPNANLYCTLGVHRNPKGMSLRETGHAESLRDRCGVQPAYPRAPM